MYASTREPQYWTGMTANDRHVWNDALQAVVLALACNEPDPMCPDALIDADPCIACEQKECARDLVIKRVLELKRSASR